MWREPVAVICKPWSSSSAPAPPIASTAWSKALPSSPVLESVSSAAVVSVPSVRPLVPVTSLPPLSVCKGVAAEDESLVPVVPAVAPSSVPESSPQPALSASREAQDSAPSHVDRPVRLE